MVGKDGESKASKPTINSNKVGRNETLPLRQAAKNTKKCHGASTASKAV